MTKIKLNETEFKMVAQYLKWVIDTYKVSSIDSLFHVDTVSRILNKMSKMYRLGKRNYSLSFNVAETLVMVVLLPHLSQSPDPLASAIGLSSYTNLSKQIDYAISTYPLK